MFRASQTFVRAAWPIASSRARVSQQTAPFALALYRQRPLLALASPQTAHYSSGPKDRDDPPPPKPEIDREAIRKRQQDTLKPNPSGVSSDSTTRKAFDGPITPAISKGHGSEENIQSGLKHDVGIIRDTFRLSNIPRESHILGLAGTIPYLATSVSTLFLAWDLSAQLPTGNALLDTVFVNHDTARYLLSVIEPLQLGYGAVIISFLGAIHWGLEYAEKSPSLNRTRFRYGMGVAASVIAWPTLLLSIEYGLTAQFMAFVALYFADSRASHRGWAPYWYAQYRFLLTAMVGLAIFVSLVGRSEIEKSERLSKGYLKSSLNRPGLADKETNWVKLEAEEKKKIKKEKEEKERKAKREEQKKKQDERAEKAGGTSTKGNKDKDEPKEDEKSEKQSKDEGEGDDGEQKEEDEQNGGEEEGEKGGNKGEDKEGGEKQAEAKAKGDSKDGKESKRK